VRRVFQLLDSLFVSRVGNALTWLSILSLGAALVVAVGLVGAQVVHVAGWVTLACFGVWSLVALLFAVASVMRRQPSTLSSPAAQIVIAKGLPRSSAALLNALVRAESQGREFIAEAALLDPVNNQEPTADFARNYSAYEADVAALLTNTNELDDRWSSLWARKPSWVEGHLGDLLEPPFYGEKLEVLGRYIALRTRQLGWMIRYLQGGTDEPVRYIRYWPTQGEEPQSEKT